MNFTDRFHRQISQTAREGGGFFERKKVSSFAFL
jgi:hypothetical protein